MIDSAFSTGKSYYSQLFLEERKHIVKEKRKAKCITDNFEISSNEENSKEKILIKEIIVNNKLSIMIMSFLKEQFLTMSFLREKFLIVSFWGNNFNKYLSCF